MRGNRPLDSFALNLAVMDLMLVIVGERRWLWILSDHVDDQVDLFVVFLFTAD